MDMDTAKGSGDLISSSEANETGEEGATCIETELVEIEEEAEGLEEKMQTDQFFDISCRFLESNLSSLFSSPCKDDTTTSLSPMHFTHTTTGDAHDAASVASTLQIFSIKVKEIRKALQSNWPLHVYGMVATRDTVDRNRNILFLRGRDNCQILTQKDPCLQLTGPSRAIVAVDPVHFEIDLKVKGGRKSQDRVLMRQTFTYSGNETTLLSDDYCKIMLRCAKLEKTVQATIVGVRVINWRKRAWPFKHGGQVCCVARGSVKPEEEVVLQDQVTAANTSHGYLDLSRHVVSVELNGELRVIIRSSKFRGHVFFPAQECKVSRGICDLGPYKVEVTVAWSLLIRDKRCISREECVDDGQSFEHTADIQRRKHTETTLETQSATETIQAEIYRLLDLISKNAMKLKDEPKLRISEYSISEVQIHMDNMYSEVTNLLRMMEMQASRTSYKYGLNAIFNGLDQLCTRLDQMGHLSYKGTLKSQSLDEIEVDEAPLIISIETVEADKGKDEVLPRISSSTDIKLEIEDAKEMGGEAKYSDEASARISTSMETELEIEEAKEIGEEAKMHKVLTEEESFERYRHSWVSNWSIHCGTFTEKTSLSPMHFTHSTPGHTPFGAFVASTLQIYSIKVTKIEEVSGLNWPLRVYGVVAARDTVDRNRNIIFSRQRNNCQILTPEDPFLRLTGPSRAIVTREPVHVEIELKVKGRTKSADRVLMSHAWYYSGNYFGLLHTPLVRNYCTMVLSLEELQESVQATIVGIRVRVPEGRPSPFEYGGRVVCSSLPRRKGRLPDSAHITDPSFRQVVLQDGAITSCSKGYLNLSRHVVSVELRGKLEVFIDARSHSGAMAGQVSIKAQPCDITEDVCNLGDSQLDIVVAWSRLVRGESW